jgi:hypothetical protein
VRREAGLEGAFYKAEEEGEGAAQAVGREAPAVKAIKARRAQWGDDCRRGDESGVSGPRCIDGKLGREERKG